MFARGIIVLLCVLVAISDGERAPDYRYSPIMCTMEYKPVCGSDGITYGNECALRAAIEESGREILIQKEGRCEDEDLEKE